VILNNNPESQELDLSRYAEGLNAASTGKEILSNRQVDLKTTLKVEGKTPMVIELN